MKKFILFFRENVQKVSNSCCSWLTEAFRIWHFNILNLNKDLFISYNNTLLNTKSYAKQALLVGILCALFIPEKSFSQTITLDGNPSDWGPVLGAGSSVVVKSHVRDANDTDDSQFTGGSQDPDLISEWTWSLGNTNDKGDISNAAAAIIDNKLYFAGDRTAINGDAQIGFWFLLGGVAPLNGGTFSGSHVNGDLLALSNFTNGGGAVQIRLYRWTNGALAFVGTYNNAMVNTSSVFAPTAQVPAWTYQGKKLGSTTPAPNEYLTGAFFEGYIDLGDINIPDHCFQTFLLETRNSASVDASLQDLVANAFRAKPANPTVADATRCGPGPVTLSVSCADPALVTRWYANAQGGSPIPAPDTSNVTQNATYYVTCYNAQLNCESDRVPINIIINPGPSASGTPTHVACNGAATGAINLNPSGGAPPYSFAWSASNGGAIPSGQADDEDLSGLVAGTYSVIVTDSKGCIGNAEVVITQPPLVLPDITKDPGFASTPCGVSPTQAQNQINTAFNAWFSAGVVVVNGGTPPYNIVSNPLNPTAPLYSGGSTQVTWTITDACNKTDVVVASFDVSNNCAITCLATPSPVACNGDSTGSILARGSGGFPPYNFYLYLSSDLNTQLASITNVNTEPGEATFQNLPAGSYTILITDSVQGLNEATACDATVTQPTALQASDSHTDVLCNGGSTGSVTINFSGGTGPYMVNFNGGGFASQVSGVVYSNLAAGNYPWVVRDANNCTFNGSETVGQPTALQASDSHTDVLCNGGSTGSVTINFSGGTGPYMVSFNGGGFASQVSGVVYSNLAAGNYPWIVRDANNCIFEGSETVGQPSALQASDSHTDVLCNGGSTGSVTINFSGGTGPYMVNFNGGGFASQVSGVVYNNLAAGNYPWVVRDANNCIYEGSEAVGQPSTLQASDSHNDVLCNGGSTGSVTLTFSGGTGPYMVSFNGGGFASQVSGVVYNNLAAGNYPWVVRDANNCIYEGSETVGQPSALQASDSHTDAACNGGTGSVTINFSGGTGPYMVNFNGGGFASQVSGVVYNNLAAGNYPWVVRDANNCIYEGSEAVGQPSTLQASDSHNDVLCNGGSTGSVILSFSGGTGPYMVSFNGGAFAPQISGVVYNGLAAGNYPWIVRDANNCTYNGSETVGQPSALQASDSHNDALCNGSSTGSVTLTFSGGTGPYMVNFNGGGFASQVSGVVYSNLAAGNYPWIVRDANNCTYNSSETVGQPSAVDLSLTSQPENCEGTNTGSITATFSGGVGGYMINIDGGAFEPATSPHVFNNLGTGVHTVIVMDRNECRDSAEIRVGAIPCDGPHCTYTQGYYGAYNGSACTVEGAPTNDYLIMLDAITDVGGTYDFGRISTGNYFRLFSSDITGAANIANNKIFIMLPGGGTPRALVGYDYYDNPAGVPSSWRNDNNPLTKSGPKTGAINNNLLSQTMTLFFNTHVDPTLLSFALEVKFATQDVACGSNVPIPDTYKEFTIPVSVINYLAGHGGATVGNLFNLANDALGGVNIGGLNHSDVNKAVDAINNAFDQCRVRVPLQIALPTFTYIDSGLTEPIFTAYPVPFKDQLTIKYQFDYITKAKIDIYSSTGALLMSQDDNDAYFNKEVTITPRFNIGESQLFFVKVTTDRGQSILKVISEK